LQGTLAVIFNEQALAGGGFLIAAHFQPQGISGTSTSGAKYLATGLTRDITIAVPAGGFTETTINRFHIVGTAGAPTYSVADTFHIAVTADGVVRTVVDRHSEVCMLHPASLHQGGARALFETADASDTRRRHYATDALQAGHPPLIGRPPLISSSSEP
jgi:hypothetical protein